MPFKLTIEQGKGRGQVLEFDQDEISFGREEGNDVVLFEGGISRRHASITFDGASYVLNDLGSSNGTLLNGNKVASEALESGDRIGVGPAVFLFEAATTGASTRIVSLEQAEKAAAAKSQRSAPAPAAHASRPAPAAPSEPMDPKRRKLLIAVGVVLLLVFVGVLVKKKSGRRRGLRECPSVIEVASAEGFVFGRGVDADCEAAKSGLKLGFNGQSRTRYILHYAPFFVKQGELAIYVNGQRVGDSPAAPTRRAQRQVIVLPDAAVKEGNNEVTFQPAKSTDDTWGVERVELESIGLREADAAKAMEHYRLGSKLYHDKMVAAPNLYNAWLEMRDARRYMEGLDAKPDFYQPTLDLIRDVERELDALCKERLFAAQRDGRYDRYDRANESYKFILEAFPGSAHPCRKQAEDNMFVTE